ncbi:MAG: glucose-6-phosphate dehydrogenase [Propionibacteriaceae bacterium]|nr:glucose-6-phosphate dehydrogenase [Propionibacteriaceae bacterium]
MSEATQPTRPVAPSEQSDPGAVSGREHTDAPTLVILGASGDLTSRLLLPGLGTLMAHEPDRRINLVGADRKEWGDEAWRERVLEAMCRGGARPEVAAGLARDARYQQLDVMDPEAWPAFVRSLAPDSVLYFALPPAVTMAACRLLTRADLPAGLRLGLEKPFGNDLASAQEFNRLLADLVTEEQVFRVDHFLGKSTVLNILGVRFANRLFEPVWSAADIERVDIVFDESLALEGRAGYYDKAGALIDMIQSHLLLVMAMLAMEEPNRIDHVELRDLMMHVLRATHCHPDHPSHRARYTAGQVGGKDVPSYADEPGVDPARETDTLAEVTLEIRSRRWAGVPFRLRSGKGLGDARRLAILYFRPVAHLPEGFTGEVNQNVLLFDLGEGSLGLRIATNGEGDKLSLEETVFDAQIGDSPVRPYGEILSGILDGNPLLSVRGDIAEECWRIVAPIIDAWRAGEVPLDDYPAGTMGPLTWGVV